MMIALTMNAIAQKTIDNSLYTFCGKSGDCMISVDELEKCKKELLLTDKDMRIISFHVSISSKGAFTDHVCNDYIFNSEINKALDGLIAGDKVLIEEVVIAHGDKIIPGHAMVITLK